MHRRFPPGAARGAARRLAVVGLAIGFVHAWAAPAAAQAPNPLPVPWIGQAYCQEHCGGGTWWQGRNNCGPASLAMVAEGNGIPRPNGMSRAAYVRHVKTLTEGKDDCSPTNRAELDRGAAGLGLCLRDEAWSTTHIESLTQSCLPVATYLDDRTMPWRFNRAFYLGADHIVVTTGFPGDDVALNDPLENSTGDFACDPMPPDAENRVYGSAHTRYERADYDTAAYLADLGWWGKAYGDALGGCDVPGCNPGGGGGGTEGGPFIKVTVRMASHCPDNRMRVYYVTDHTASDGSFRERWSKGKTIQNDGRFHTYTITFDGETSRRYWRGRLLKLRIDPSTSSGCLVAFSWIGVHDGENRTAGSWMFPAGTGADWWWARDTVTTGFIGPFWAMHTTSHDPWIEKDNVGIDIGR